MANILQDKFKRYRRPGDIVFAVLFLAFSIFLMTQLGEQTKLVKRTKWFAQPGLWPTIAISGMVAFAALHYLISALSPRLPGRRAEVSFWLGSLEYVFYFLVYVKLVPFLGYLPSTVLFDVCLALRVGFRDARIIGIAAIFGVCVAVIFRAFLQVKIPAGTLYENLPEGLRAFALTYL